MCKNSVYNQKTSRHQGQFGDESRRRKNARAPPWAGFTPLKIKSIERGGGGKLLIQLGKRKTGEDKGGTERKSDGHNCSCGSTESGPVSV